MAVHTKRMVIVLTKWSWFYPLANPLLVGKNDCTEVDTPILDDIDSPVIDTAARQEVTVERKLDALTDDLCVGTNGFPLVTFHQHLTICFKGNSFYYKIFYEFSKASIFKFLIDNPTVHLPIRIDSLAIALKLM